MRNQKTRKIALAALFASMAIVLKTFLSIQLGDSMRISLFPIPLLIGGFLLGPLWGLLIGFVTDTVYFMISPFASFWSVYTISTMIWGLGGGLIKLVPVKKDLWKYIIIIAITTILETLINTLANVIYGFSNATLLWRVLAMIIRFPFLVFTTQIILKQFLLLMDSNPLEK
ncbi:MAG: folate family ECF transporter S component [Bacilli bacterium]